MKQKADFHKEYAEFYFADSVEDTYVELTFPLPFKEGKKYIFMPACCYAGNQFEVLKKDYPPLFTPEEARIDMPVTITDIPRLEMDGSGIIEVTTGDLSVPCVGIWSEEEKKALFIFTIQQIDGINLGISYEKGNVCISYPHMRKKEMYIWPYMRPSRDEGMNFEKGKRIEIPYRVFELPCSNLKEFYHFFFLHRKCMGLDHEMPQVMNPAEQFEIQKNKMNRQNWREEAGFYDTAPSREEKICWQPGWIGGGMYTYALMKLGGEIEWERSIRTLEHLFKGQAPSGLFYEFGDAEGNFIKGIFGVEGTENWALVRKSGDILYYLFKHFALMKEKGVQIPEHFERGARKVADVFVKIWETYGQFGQFADLDTGELIVGGSSAGAIVAGGLVRAATYFGEERYLDVAKESAEYYSLFALKFGYTTGGPEEILQCPDSESAFALVESLAALYEATGEEKWLDYGRYMVEYSSSWVVAYNYQFPEGSEFHRLNKKSIGCVFANLQNKHAAPGICTFSGDSIYRFYQWTGERKYLELFYDIVKSVNQYLSTEEIPIYTWSVPLNATLLKEEEVKEEESRPLPSGYICERVNLSDWETEKCVGGVFYASCCWCETANLMILAECQEALKKDFRENMSEL